MSDFMQIKTEELAAKEKAAFDRGKAEGKSEAETSAKDLIAAASAASAKTERERIQSVLSIPHAGHEELIRGLAFDGKSTKADAALAIIEAEKSTREKVKADITKDAPKPLDGGGDPGAGSGADSKEFSEERCKKNWDANKDGVRDNFMSLAGYVAFEKQMALGNVRILQKGAN